MMQDNRTYPETPKRGTLIGDCVIVRELCPSGCGSAYLARDIDEGCLLAITTNAVYDPPLEDRGSHRSARRTTVQRHFQRVSDLLMAHDHPNIAKVQRVFEPPFERWYAMPHMQGTLLSEWVVENGAPDRSLLVRLLQSLLSALEYLHAHGLVHGKVCPENIFMSKKGSPFLVGFSFARNMEEGLAAKDLTALGATLYSTITGTSPSVDDVPGAVSDPLAGIPELEERYGKSLLELIDRSMSSDPAARWQSAEEWNSALIAEEHHTTVASTVDAAWEEPARHPTEPAPQESLPEAKERRGVLRARLWTSAVVAVGAGVCLFAIFGGEGKTGPDSSSAVKHEVSIEPEPADAAHRPLPAEVAQVLQEAVQGDADAQTSMAMLYLYGSGVEQDIQEAVRWARKAARQGRVDAQAMMGKFYLYGHGVEQDQAEAIKWYRMAAEQGHVESQCRLGILYACGQGTAKDGAEGLKWLCKAAEQGQTEAEYLVGLCYTGGFSMPRNIEEGCRFFRKASEQGAARSFLFCGICEGMCGNEAESEKWLKRALDSGSVAASSLLSIHDTLADSERCRAALEPFFVAAERGDAEAMCLLGVCYSVGLGVEPNLDESARIYKKAAALGCEEAQDNLALFYIFGRSVALDFKEAANLFTLAAKQGYSPAQCSLGSCYMMGRGVAPDSEYAFRWYLSAAKKGLSDAQYNVGTCYMMGLGVERNVEKAVEYFRMAAEQGLVDAQYLLGNCYEAGLGWHAMPKPPPIGTGKPPRRAAITPARPSGVSKANDAFQPLKTETLRRLLGRAYSAHILFTPIPRP